MSHDPMLTLVKIVPSADGLWYVRGLAGNGETLWTSETYNNIEDARAHAESYDIQIIIEESQ